MQSMTDSGMVVFKLVVCLRFVSFPVIQIPDHTHSVFALGLSLNSVCEGQCRLPKLNFQCLRVRIPNCGSLIAKTTLRCTRLSSRYVSRLLLCTRRVLRHIGFSRLNDTFVRAVGLNFVP
jgi:hypothetical protein